MLMHQVEVGDRQLFELDRQQPVRLVWQVSADGQVLHEEQQAGINADDCRCACAQRPPAEVTVAAADIEHFQTADPVKMRRQPLPFPVGTPFRRNVHAEQLERAFAPGVQTLKGRFQLRPFGRTRLAGYDHAGEKS